MADTVRDHDWVLAAPFRAHLRQLQAASGLPWGVLALAAGVSPALVRHLVLGNRGRRPHRLSPESARRLIGLDGAQLARLGTEWVPAARTTRQLGDLLAGGADPGQLAAWCRLTPAGLAALARATRCTRLVALLVEAACPPRLAGETDEDGEWVAA